VIVALSIATVACRTKKERFSRFESEPIETQQNTPFINVDNLFQKVIENEIQYNTLTMKIDANVVFGTQTQDFVGSVRIKRDSIIWISIRKLNLEGARICITKDSVIFIDRLNNSFYAKDYTTFANNFDLDLDYKAFEAILTNSFFFYPCSDNLNLIDNFKNCVDKDNYCISSLSRKQTSRYFNEKLYTKKYNERLQNKLNETNKKNIDDFVFQIMKIRADRYKIANVFLENNIDQQSVYINYENFTNKFNQYFPQVIKMELRSKQMTLDLDFIVSEIVFNPTDLTFPIKITNKMKEIKFD
jgi:hypothetical protein